jgi:hypothetical protein
VLAEHQWQPAFDWLVPFSHWITPRLIVARFDTRFFVAELPRGQSALHDTIETSEGVWLTPTQALHPTYHTVYATAQHLRRLTSYGSVAELLSFAREKPIRMVSPDLEEGPEGIRAQIPEHLADQW